MMAINNFFFIIGKNTTIVLLLLIFPLSAHSLPRGLANFLFSLTDGSLVPPRLSELSHFRAFSCTNRRDGAYPDLQGSCLSYYRCLGGSVYSYVCPDGEAFDMEHQECLPSSKVVCPTLPPQTSRCHNQTDGFYPDYDASCTTYYRCKDAELAGTGKCDRGALWDFATASCGAGPRASCSPPSCWGLPDGAHPVQGSRCAAFFTCNDGLRTDQVCPSGTSFDYMEKACVSNSGGSVCYERVCEGRANGVHAMPHAPCHAYFRCFNAALIEVEMCPPRHIFDGWECVQTANFSCWSDSNGSCSERPDAVYAADDKECRGFFLCRQKRLVRSFRCSPGLVFNGETCVDSQNYICSSRPRVPNCTNKPDGYYTIDKSNCRSFYYCRNEAKLSEHNCPGNYIFNGEQCVDPHLFSCSGRDIANNNSTYSRHRRLNRDTECSIAENGFYVEPETNCSKFFQCIDGKKISVHSCPNGQAFSGEQCVPSDKFVCPFEESSSKDCLNKTNGLYRDVNDCSKYHQCLNSDKISYKCPIEMTFNGIECRKSSSINECDVQYACQNLIDGTYDGPCDAKFVCKNSKTVSYEGCRNS